MSGQQSFPAFCPSRLRIVTKTPPTLTKVLICVSPFCRDKGREVLSVFRSAGESLLLPRSGSTGRGEGCSLLGD